MEEIFDYKRKISIRFSRNVRVQSLDKVPKTPGDVGRPSKPDKKITIGDLTEGQLLELQKIVSEEDRECKNYWNIEDFAEFFIDDIIDESIKKILEKHPDLTIQPFLKDESFRVEWPKIEQFTVELGKEKIDEYLSFWYVAENWKYHIEFKSSEEDECSTFYKYEAIFGIPNRQYPVCQVTASVYFTIEASKIKPKQCKVDVFYNFEGERLKHYPEKYGFQESWLLHIVQGKLNIIKTLDF